ncbi:hypothetical protein U1Q18_028385, partial [Sarracenia purpurea var. burkii]
MGPKEIIFVEANLLVGVITEEGIITQEVEEVEDSITLHVKFMGEIIILPQTAIIEWIQNINKDQINKDKEVKLQGISFLKHYLLQIQNMNKNKCL